MTNKLPIVLLSILTLGAVSAVAQTAAPATPPASTPSMPMNTPPATSMPMPAPAAPAAMTTPGMTGPLAANSNPTKFDLGALGTWYVTGAVSGIAFTQSHAFPGEIKNRTDMSNGQVFIQKTDGLFQFFVQAGEYSLPDLGVPYLRADASLNAFYGPLPQAFVQIAPTSSFNVRIGKLPTLIGAEYTFSFENSNIQRGLLWNQENAVNRGVQANYTTGTYTFAASLNDGLYSNRYNWLTGSVTDAIDSANSISFVAGVSTKRTTVSTLATPLFLNNQQIYNLIYTRTEGPWTFTPYLQYTSVPKSSQLGTGEKGTTFGAALLANYTFDAKSEFAGISLPVRVEYIGSTGGASKGAPNLIYGPGSSAWSVTFTPTYQYKLFFIRGEVSYVKASHITGGAAFGPLGNDTQQTRAVIETGVLF